LRSPQNPPAKRLDFNGVERDENKKNEIYTLSLLTKEAKDKKNDSNVRNPSFNSFVFSLLYISIPSKQDLISVRGCVSAVRC
jgi:hypothetical protein